MQWWFGMAEYNGYECNIQASIKNLKHAMKAINLVWPPNLATLTRLLHFRNPTGPWNLPLFWVTFFVVSSSCSNQPKLISSQLDSNRPKLISSQLGFMGRLSLWTPLLLIILHL